MAYTQSILSPDPLYLQTKSYDAKADRKWFSDLLSPGVVGSGSFAVTWSSAMSFNVAAGVAYVLGQNIADQGTYRVYTSGVTGPMAIGAAHATLPRIDTIILRVLDNAADSSTFNEARIEIVPGTATSGADLTNLTGKANLLTLTDASKSVIVLSYVLVPAAAVALDATKFKDARTQSAVGGGNAAGSGIPIGTSIEWNGASAPPDGGIWLFEDGSAVSRSTYAVTFARIGILHGAGDGSTTFNLPDSRGRVPVGLGTNAAVATVGLNDGVAVANRRPQHRHTPHSHLIRINSFSPPGGGAAQLAIGSTNNSNFTDPADGGSGVATDSLDAPAFVVKGKWIRVA